MPRPSFAPTDEHRNLVAALVGLGIPEAEICRLILNPTGGKGIDTKTLRKHFAAEIETGQTKANAQVGGFIFSSIIGRPSGNIPIVTDDSARSRLAIFWAKTRMGWKETTVAEVTGKDGGPIDVNVTNEARDDIIASLARIAERLVGDEAGASAGDGAPEDPGADQAGGV